MKNKVIVLKELNKELEARMKGLNYVTEFGILDLGYFYNRNQLWNFFKEYFPNESSYTSKLIDYSVDKFWNTLKYAFNYRGDYGAGIKLSKLQEKELTQIQERYIIELKKLITSKSKFFTYKGFEGVSYYPVFWGYNALFETENNWYFIFGTSSD